MVLIPFVIPYIDWYSIFGENSFEIVFCILFIFYGLLSYFITNSMNLYQQTIKTEIFPNILNFLAEFQYNHETQKSAGSYEYSGLIPIIKEKQVKITCMVHTKELPLIYLKQN